MDPQDWTVSGVGVYHKGKKISELVFPFMTAVENVFNPQIYQRMFGQYKVGSESIGNYLKPFFYISIFIVLSVTLLYKEDPFISSANIYKLNSKYRSEYPYDHEVWCTRRGRGYSAGGIEVRYY